MDDLQVARLKPNEPVIAVLTELLGQAKRGEIKSLVWLAVYLDTTETGHVGDLYDRFGVMGHIEAMKIDYWLRRKEGDR